MGALELLLVAVGLSMDAFAVAVGKGLAMRRVNWRVALTLAVFFGGFQALMPLVGWALGSQLLWLIAPVDHWIAFGLLGLIGGKMIWDAVTDGKADAHAAAADDALPGLTECLVLAVATSIDALAVGISLAALGASVGVAAGIIGITTFLLTLVGVKVGNVFGARHERGATVVGGVILVLIGLRILVEHLGLLP